MDDSLLPPDDKRVHGERKSKGCTAKGLEYHPPWGLLKLI
jgi:hypothetical protein